MLPGFLKILNPGLTAFRLECPGSRRGGRSFKQLALVCLVAALSACTSIEVYREDYPNPDDRLNHILSLYRISQEQGSGCLEIWKVGFATTDCERLLVELERLAAEFPQHPRILTTNGVLQYNARRLDKAQFYLDQVINQPGPHPEAAVLRARIAMLQGNEILAQQLLERELTLSPENAEVRNALAAVFYSNGDYTKARSLMQAPVGQAPSDTWRTAYHHGLLAEGEEDWKGACLYYRLALEQQPDYRPALSRIIGLAEHVECEPP